MLAANIWHWWIGVILTAASLATVAALVAGYVKKVVMPQYPSRRNSDD